MITIDANNIKEITLLTIEDAKRLNRLILASPKWWWLRSPGINQRCVSLVQANGDIYHTGVEVNSALGGVRPALKINGIEQLNLNIGDRVCCLNHTWFYVGNDLILFEYLAGVCKYNYMRNGNEFDGSIIQTLLTHWLSKELDAYYDIDRKEAKA